MPIVRRFRERNLNSDKELPETERKEILFRPWHDRSHLLASIALLRESLRVRSLTIPKDSLKSLAESFLKRSSASQKTTDIQAAYLCNGTIQITLKQFHYLTAEDRIFH